MTFLETRFRLTRPINEKDFPKFGLLTAVYGIRGLSVEGGELIANYDASRIHAAEMLAAVRTFGFPVAPAEPIPPGAFDDTGEFRDFAWPTTGLSPANQKQK